MRSMRAVDEKWPLLACMYKRYGRLLFPISNGVLSVEGRAPPPPSILIYLSFLKCHMIKLSGTQPKLFLIKEKQEISTEQLPLPLHEVTVTSQTSLFLTLNVEFLALTVSCTLKEIISNFWRRNVEQYQVVLGKKRGK